MAIIRWEPAREFDMLQSEMNRMLGGLLGSEGTSPGQARRWVPAMDMFEDGDDYVLHADLPGLTQDDVEVIYDERTLTVRGERAWKHEDKREGYIRNERSYGSFERRLTLPAEIDPDAITATVADGVLEVRIPKPVQAKPRRISVVGRADGDVEVEAGQPDVAHA